MHHSSKNYGHDLGFSCTFRQWRAVESHCSKLHGYAVAVKLEFEAEALDHRNWVMDFGGLKPVKEFLTETFDHKTVVAYDDPDGDWFREGEKRRICDLVWVEAVGCEKFAELVFKWVDSWMFQNNHTARVHLTKVTVSEHGANSASYSE